MSNSDPHYLLAQVALTVSPFVSLPSATTLPYTYKTLPSSLPPSSTVDKSGTADANGRPAFILSSAGQAAHPQDIQQSCQKLQEHLSKLRQESSKSFADWEEGIRSRELAEKRRVAPGWLDRDEKILQPERNQTTREQTTLQPQQARQPTQESSNQDTTEGEAIDRAFGTLGINSRARD